MCVLCTCVASFLIHVHIGADACAALAGLSVRGGVSVHAQVVHSAGLQVLDHAGAVRGAVPALLGAGGGVSVADRVRAVVPAVLHRRVADLHRAAEPHQLPLGAVRPGQDPGDVAGGVRHPVCDSGCRYLGWIFALHRRFYRYAHLQFVISGMKVNEDYYFVY